MLLIAVFALIGCAKVIYNEPEEPTVTTASQPTRLPVPRYGYPFEFSGGGIALFSSCLNGSVLTLPIVGSPRFRLDYHSALGVNGQAGDVGIEMGLIESLSTESGDDFDKVYQADLCRIRIIGGYVRGWPVGRITKIDSTGSEREIGTF